MSAPRSAKDRSGSNASRRSTGSISRKQKLFRWSEAEGVRTCRSWLHVCSLAPRAAGGFVGAGYDGFLAIGPDLQPTLIGNPEPELPGNRFNDGKMDRPGRFWAGTMDRLSAQDSGSLYRLDPDLMLDPDRQRLPGHQRPCVQPRWPDALPHRFRAAARLRLRSRRGWQRVEQARPPAVRRRRRLSGRHDRRCRRLPVDRLLGRLVRAPLLAVRGAARRDRACRRSARPASRSAAPISTSSFITSASRDLSASRT